jgi:hypothetical protein
MANQVSKKITFNEPAPKNIQNAGIVRVENFNRVVEDITTLFNLAKPSGTTIATDGTVVTGPGVFISQSILIPANTLADGNFIDLYWAYSRLSGGTAVQIQVYTNTTNSLVGANLLRTAGNLTATVSIGATSVYAVSGNTLRFSPNPVQLASSEYTQSTTGINTAAFNPAVDNYIIFACNLPLAGTAAVNLVKLEIHA